MYNNNYWILKEKHKIYFASDIHLGLPNHSESLIREKHFVKWLDTIKKDATEIFLVGDIFDFWFEYKKVVPRGFTRLISKLAEIVESGIPVYFFTGNHDIWVFDYLPAETGVILQRDSLTIVRNSKKFFISHGDGLGPGDIKFKFLKRIFTSAFFQWCFARLHPNFGLLLAHKWSIGSRYSQGTTPEYFGDNKEWLVLFAKEKLKQEYFDFFIFGHRHLMLNIQLEKGSRFINLGDWIKKFSYAVFDGEEILLKQYPLADNS